MHQDLWDSVEQEINIMNMRSTNVKQLSEKEDSKRVLSNVSTLLGLCKGRTQRQRIVHVFTVNKIKISKKTKQL